jgi:hypothetical protein
MRLGVPSGIQAFLFKGLRRFPVVRQNHGTGQAFFAKQQPLTKASSAMPEHELSISMVSFCLGTMTPWKPGERSKGE